MSRVLVWLPVWAALACNTSSSPALQAAEEKLREGQANAYSPEGVVSLRQAAQLFQAGGNAAKRAEALYWLALAEQEAKDFRSALTTMNEALATYSGEAGFYDGVNAHLVIGELQTELADYPAAQAAFERARQQAIQSASRWNEWRSLEGLAKLRAQQGQPAAARAAWAEAHAIVAPLSLWGLGHVSKAWADLEAAQGDADAARKLYSEAIDAHQKALDELESNPSTHGHRRHVERSRLGAAQARLASARLESTREEYQAAADACREGLAIMVSMPTVAEKDEAGLEWDFGARANRTVLDELRQLLAEVQGKLGPGGRPEPVSPEVLGAIRVRDGKVSLARWLVERLRKEPELLTRAARFVPEEKAGKTVAVRVFAVREDTLWGALGFENGDRLNTINGHAAPILYESKAARQALLEASSLRVGLDRRGVPHQLEFFAE